MMKQSKTPELLLVFAGYLLVFLLSLAANFSGPHDSIHYLNGFIKGGEYLSHPHHLLYHYSAHYWLQLAQSIFPGIEDYYLAESFSAVCGAVSMAIIYGFFRWRFHWNKISSLVFSSVVAFSYGMWFYSANIEVYAPAMMFLLASLYFLTSPSFDNKALWKSSLFHCLAILFHQVHVLFTIVFVLVLWTRRKEISFRKSFLTYAATGILLVVGVYFLMGWVVAGQHSPDAWIGWMRGYTTHEDYWQLPGPQTPVRVITGFSHAFIGGHFAFKLPGMDQYLGQMRSAHSLHDEMFLASNISNAMAIFLTILTVLSGLVMLVLVVRFFKKIRSVRRTWPAVVMPLFWTGLLYSAFFCVWMPEILEFWIFQTVLVWLLLLGTLSVTGFPFGARPVIVGLVCSISLCCINYFGSIRWLKDLNHDWYYLKVLPVKDEVNEKDIILVQKGWILSDFLEYFTKAKVMEAPKATSQIPAVDSTIHAGLQQGGRLFIYPEEKGNTGPIPAAYVDSLLHHYQQGKRVLRAADPEVLIVTP